jgi:uncharacterized membrane protein YcaP (DUF421 family)
VPSWFYGLGGSLWIVAAKAALMYVTAVIGLRFAHRRTLSQWTAIDFAAAVAIGAIVGRTALADNQAFAVGAVALFTLLGLHWVVSMGRYSRLFAKLVDHRIRVVLDHGKVRKDQLLICGVTENDLLGKLRELGVRDVSELHYVFYETKGELTIVKEDGTDSRLVELGLEHAAGWPPRKP